MLSSMAAFWTLGNLFVASKFLIFFIYLTFYSVFLKIHTSPLFLKLIFSGTIFKYSKYRVFFIYLIQKIVLIYQDSVRGAEI